MTFDFEPLTDRQRRNLRVLGSVLILLATLSLAVALGALWTIGEHAPTFLLSIVFSVAWCVLLLIQFALIALLYLLFRSTGSSP